MALPTWAVPSSSTSLRGCPVCVPRLCRALCGAEQSMGQGCVQRWLSVARCQPCPPPSIPGCKGATALCLADIYGVVWSILVPRQPISNENDEISLCHWFGARLILEYRIVGQPLAWQSQGLAVLVLVQNWACWIWNSVPSWIN